MMQDPYKCLTLHHERVVLREVWQRRALETKAISTSTVYTQCPSVQFHLWRFSLEATSDQLVSYSCGVIASIACSTGQQAMF